MKTKRIKAALLSAALLFSAVAVFAQSGGAFNLKAAVIASGGGMSTSAVYSLRGTIGQPLAGGPLSNGVYCVTSGFWAAIQLVQTPGAPPFGGIRVVAGNIVISWPVWRTGYRLQSTATVGDPASWVDWPDPPLVAGDQNTVEFRPITNPPLRFFRLIRVEP
jgi:hypothetical protein